MRVEFLISANVGEEPRPLDKVASGGELSRIALALKTSALRSARAKGVQRTLVFDEIDTGIGGGVAEAVGRRLKKLSGSSQVLVRHASGASGRIRRSPLLRRKARSERPHSRRNRGTARRSPDTRDRPHAIRPAADARGVEASRTFDQSGTGKWPRMNTEEHRYLTS